MYGEISLPTWDRERFFELWKAIRSRKASIREKNDFAGLFMVCVEQNLSTKGLIQSLRASRIDREDAASYIVEKLAPKLLKMKLNKPCELVFMSVVNRSIQRKLIDYLRSEGREKHHASLELGKEDEIDFSPEAPTLPVVSDLQMFLIEHGKEICEDNRKLGYAYLQLVKTIARAKQEIGLLPKWIARRLSTDETAILTFSFNKAVAAFSREDHGQAPREDQSARCVPAFS